MSIWFHTAPVLQGCAVSFLLQHVLISLLRTWYMVCAFHVLPSWVFVLGERRSTVQLPSGFHWNTSYSAHPDFQFFPRPMDEKNFFVNAFLTANFFTGRPVCFDSNCFSLRARWSMFVWFLPIDLSSMGGPTRRLSSNWFSSDRRGTQDVPQ